jgi:hypothetical protein
MTTLAQMIVDHPQPHNRTSDTQETIDYSFRVYETIRQFLLPVEITQPKSPESIPSKFVFCEDAPGAVFELIKSKQIDRSVVISSINFPSPLFWIEWKQKKSATYIKKENTIHFQRMGAFLFQKNFIKEQVALLDSNAKLQTKNGDFRALDVPDWDASEYTAFIIGALEEKRAPIVLYIFEFKNHRNSALLTWVHPAVRRESDNGEPNKASLIVQDLFYIMFLINVPRVCEISEIKHDAKLQKCRQKAGKMPLIEYKQMILRIGVGGTRAAHRNGSGVTSDHPDGRRLHEVIGHFRTYTKDRETPMVSYVPHHWRGDPEKGIVLHERVVRS